MHEDKFIIPEVDNKLLTKSVTKSVNKSVADLFGDLALEDSLLYIISSYLNEYEVKEYRLEFDQPKLLVEAVELAIQEWGDDDAIKLTGTWFGTTESLSYYHRQLAKISKANSRTNHSNSSSSSKSNGSQHFYCVNRLEGGKLDFEQLANVKVSQFTADDVKVIIDLYRLYELGRPDKLKYRKKKTSKYFNLESNWQWYFGRRSSMEDLSQDRADKSRFGGLTDFMLNQKRDEHYGIDNDDDDDDDEY